jgi:hypothetical protein
MTWITHIAAFIAGAATLAGVIWWILYEPWPEDRAMAEEDDPYSNE